MELATRQQSQVIGYGDNNQPAILSKLNEHCLITGSTRYGKSYFTKIMASILAQDHSVIMLDPHGSLAEDCLEMLADNKRIRWDNVIYWDINSKEHVIGYNPLKRNYAIDLDKQVEIIMEACLRAWGQDSFDETPTLARWLRNGFRVLIATERTLIDGEAIFSMKPSDKRKKILQEARDIADGLKGNKDMSYVERHIIGQAVDGFEWLEAQGSRTQKDEMLSAHNRIQRFLSSETLMTIFGQKKTIDLTRIRKEKKILIVNLAARQVSYEVATLLGALIINELQHLSTLTLAEDKTFVVIDEFSTIATRSLTVSLPQTAKFGLHWVLITQFLEQIKELDRALVDAALTCCKMKVTFGGMTNDDCTTMVDEMFTGYLDLQEAKMITTKVRHRLEYIQSKSESIGKGGGDSETHSQQTNESQANGIAKGDMYGTVDGVGQAKAIGHGEQQVKAHSEMMNQGVGRNRTEGNGAGQGRSTFEGEASSISSASGIGEVSGMGQGMNIMYPTVGHYGLPKRSDSNNQMNSNSKYLSNANSSLQSSGNGENEFISTFKAAGINEFEGTGKSNLQSNGVSTTSIESHNTMKSDIHSRSTVESKLKQHGSSEGYAFGKNNTWQYSQSVTWQPMLMPEEYKEVTQYWSIEEQVYKKVEIMKTLNTGEAFIQFRGQAPYFLKVKSVKGSTFQRGFQMFKEHIAKNDLVIPYREAQQTVIDQLKETVVKKEKITQAVPAEDNFGL